MCSVSGPIGQVLNLTKISDVSMSGLKISKKVKNIAQIQNRKSM
jgi:hypothetical protein